MFKYTLYVHIFFGCLALATFWIPLVAKKGQKVHITAGIIYVTSMSLVAFTAVILCYLRLGDPLTTPHQKQFAWFLLFISLLASSSAWYALRVWRFKKRTLPHRNPLDIGISASLFIASIATILYGIAIKNSLFIYFPLIGVFLGSMQLHYWLSTPRIKMHAWFQHMNGMFSCVISTLTAFAVVGLPKLLQLESQNFLLWFGPTIVLVPILFVWQSYYRKKFGADTL